MKTPEKIKEGLECCQLHEGDMYVDCSHCPYYLTCTQCDLHLHKDALAYIQQLEAQVPKWVSVNDRLPERAMKCLVMSKAGTVFTTQYNPEIHRFPPHFAKSNITHWMLLPERRRKVNNAGN